jgi:hypothetical protein
MFLVVALSHIGKISTVYVIEQTQGYRCTYSPPGFFSRTISPRYQANREAIASIRIEGATTIGELFVRRFAIERALAAVSHRSALCGIRQWLQSC